MANQKIPSYLNAEQRQALMEIPSDLSERDLARYYSFTQEELKLINSRRRPENRLGFAVQLALLRFPGRPLKEYLSAARHLLLPEMESDRAIPLIETVLDITPLGWEHINLIGQYSFSHQSARSLDNRRPLRLPDEVDQETREIATEDRGVSFHS